MTKNNSTDRDEHASQFFSFLAAAGAGAISTWATLRSTFYSHAKGLGLFNSIEADRDKKLEALNAVSPKTTAYWDKVRKIRTDFTTEVGEIYKATGISENPFIGSLNKFEHLGTTGRLKVAGLGITVAMGAMFSLMNFSHRSHVEKMLDSINSKNVPQR